MAWYPFALPLSVCPARIASPLQTRPPSALPQSPIAQCVGGGSDGRTKRHFPVIRAITIIVTNHPTSLCGGSTVFALRSVYQFGQTGRFFRGCCPDFRFSCCASFRFLRAFFLSRRFQSAALPGNAEKWRPCARQGCRLL